MITHEDIRQIALEMPGAIERPSYGGRPSFRTKTKMFAWIRENPEALVVWVDSLDEKETMLAAQPKKFFTTPHYDGEPMVLVRLEKVSKKEAFELIVESWRNRATKTAVKAWDTERQ
jgi:hypothetical protein